MTFADFGRLSMPVKSAQTIYAQFKYVYGQAARTGQKPVALTRLRNINSYISNFKSKNPPSSISFSLDKTSANSVKKYRTIAKLAPQAKMDFGVHIDTRV